MQDKVILIIGATSMIGQVCARLLAQQGMKLMLVARDQYKLDNLASELNGNIE